MCALCLDRLCVYVDVECTDTVLPVTYPKFADMMEPGDTLYVGRYLVSGADQASLYLEVRPYFLLLLSVDLLLVVLCTMRCMVGQQGGNPTREFTNVGWGTGVTGVDGES